MIVTPGATGTAGAAGGAPAAAAEIGAAGAAGAAGAVAVVLAALSCAVVGPSVEAVGENTNDSMKSSPCWLRPRRDSPCVTTP